MKNKTINFLFTFILMFAFLMIPTTIFNNVTQVEAAVKLNKNSATLNVGDTLKLKVTGTKKTVIWSSTNKKVAKVTSKGKVKALKSGKCYIKATVGKKTYKCKIVVVNSSSEDLMQVSSNELETLLGHSTSLTVTFESDEGNLNWEVVSEPSDGALHLFWDDWNGNNCALYLYPTELGTYKIKITNSINDESELVYVYVTDTAFNECFDVSTLNLNVKTWAEDPAELWIYVDSAYASGITFYSEEIIKNDNASFYTKYGAWRDVTLNGDRTFALSNVSGIWDCSMLPLYIKGESAGEALLRISNSNNNNYIDVVITIS